MREMDFLMGGFADAEFPGLSDGDLDDLEKLLDAPDRDALAWLTGEAQLPRDYDTPLFRRLKAFHTHSRPINI